MPRYSTAKRCCRRIATIRRARSQRARPRSFACGGSATNAGGTFTDFSNYALTVDTIDAMRNTDALSNTQSADLYNFGPLNYYQRPERRYSLGAMGHYEFGEHADVYTQLMYSDYESLAQIAPGGNFGDTTTINCDNPLFPQATWQRSAAVPPRSPRARSSRCTSCGATSRAADGSSRSRTPRSASWLACAGRSTRPGATTCRCSTRRPGGRDDAQLLRDQPHAECAGRHRRGRRADLPLGRGWQRPELRALEPVRQPNGITRPSSNYLQATGISSADQPGDLQRRHQRRPRHLWLQDAVGERRHAGRVRLRVPARRAAQQRRRAADGTTSSLAPAVR